MTTRNDELPQETYAHELATKYGEVIGGRNLRHVLGFATAAAFKQAIARGQLTLPTFYIQGRKGRFALAKDVAKWLLECRANAGKPSNQHAPESFRHGKEK